MTSPFIRGHGLAARVSRGRRGSILWLHGYTLDSSIWSELWSQLGEWTHIGLDLPGHGASDAIDPREQLSDWAQRIGRFCADQGVQHLVGISFGGMVALQVASQFPAMFRSLTLASSALGGGPVEADARVRNEELYRLYHDRGAGPWMTELWMRSPPAIFAGAAKHPPLHQRLRSIVDCYSWADLESRAMNHLAEFRQSAEQLGRVRCPTLILVGEEDMTSFKRVAELIHRAIRGSRRLYVPDAGHLCLLELPHLVSGWIEEHLDVGLHTGRPDAVPPGAATLGRDPASTCKTWVSSTASSS